MQERNLRVLEYFKILDRLAGFAVTDLGREVVRGLRPTGNAVDVRRLQAETEEALSAIAFHGGSPVPWFSDVRESLQMSKVGPP